MRLAVDLGGTKAACALVDDRAVVRRATLRSRDFAALAPLLRAFVGVDRLVAAVVAVPGTVEDGACRLPLLGWTVDRAELAAALGGAMVEVVNDVVATASGLDALAPQAVTALHDGRRDPRGPRVVLAVGTGLGGAATIGGAVSPAEPGHAQWATEDEDEVRLWRFLRARDGFCHVQSVVSGRGVADAWRWLAAEDGALADPASCELAEADDPTPAIVARALAGEPRCGRAVAIVAGALAAEARAAALRWLPTGGLAIAGGMAARLRPWIATDAWRRRYLACPDLPEVPEAVPVDLINDPDAALLGAIARARDASAVEDAPVTVDPHASNASRRCGRPRDRAPIRPRSVADARPAADGSPPARALPLFPVRSRLDIV